MDHDKQKAYAMARAAAKLDFKSALDGLLAGHQDAVEAMQKQINTLDRSFLMALCLTEKGARLDKDGNMVAFIAEGLRGKGSLAPVEEAFLASAGVEPLP